MDGLGLQTGGDCPDPTLLVEFAGHAEHAGCDGLLLDDQVRN
jgi:hypothetical protein